MSMTTLSMDKMSPNKLRMNGLTLPCVTLKNGQRYFKNFAMWKHRKIFKVCLTIFQLYT